MECESRQGNWNQGSHRYKLAISQQNERPRGIPLTAPPLLSVVIPTRGRMETLPAAILSAINQDGAELEVIVADSGSVEGVEDLCRELGDPRVRCLPSAKLAMTANWERAVAAATGHYCMVLGDDDALVPGALRTVTKTLADSPTRAIVWRKVDFGWPGSSFEGLGHVTHHPSRRLTAKGTIRLLQMGLMGPSRLPSIYNGFVSATALQSLHRRTGRYFNSIVPDVYMGTAMLSELSDYVLFGTPLSINGASTTSNGEASRAPESFIASEFFQNTDLPGHPAMIAIPGSVTSGVLEAVVQANRSAFGGRLRILYPPYVRKILAEISLVPIAIRERCLSQLESCELDRVSRLMIASRRRAVLAREVTTGPTEARRIACATSVEASQITAQLSGVTPPSIPSRPVGAFSHVRSVATERLLRS